MTAEHSPGRREFLGLAGMACLALFGGGWHSARALLGGRRGQLEPSNSSCRQEIRVGIGGQGVGNYLHCPPRCFLERGHAGRRESASML